MPPIYNYVQPILTKWKVQRLYIIIKWDCMQKIRNAIWGYDVITALANNRNDTISITLYIAKRYNVKIPLKVPDEPLLVI